MAFVAQPVDSGRCTNMMPNLMLTYPKVHSYETPTKMQNTFDDTAAASSQSPRRKCSKNETIHSGHFMVSEIDESLSDRNEKDAPNEVEDGFNTDQQQSPDSFYAPVSKSVFDNSLTKLFQCMSLAYNDGKITSPKWKDFKGLKLHIKDKIRLNNIIWRAWHIQCRCLLIESLHSNQTFFCFRYHWIESSGLSVLLPSRFGHSQKDRNNSAGGKVLEAKSEHCQK